MYKDITASLVAATRKVVEASSAKAANEAAQKEHTSNLSKSMRPAYEGSAPRNAQEISLLNEKTHTIPKTPKEKSLAALAEPKDKITHADVMVGRGVKKEEKMPEKKTNAFDFRSPRKPQDAPNRKSGDVTATGHNVKKISTGTVYTKRFEEVEVSELHEATYSYNDHKAPKDAQISSGYGDLDHKAIGAHLKTLGIPHEHAKAISDHLKHEDPQDSNKKGYDVMTKHGNLTVHSAQDPDTGKNKFHVAANKAMKEEVKTLKSKLKNEELDAISEAPVDGVAPGSLENDGHLCASKVMHKEWKEGKTLFSQHAEPNEIGLIEWYDVMFEHGIEKKVPTRDLEIMVSESHMNHSKKKKM